MVELGWPIAARGGGWDATALNLAVFRGDENLAAFLLAHAPQVGSASHFILSEGDVEHPIQAVVSRPEEFHPRPLAELCVRLSPHTAPIRRTRR